MKKHPLSSLSFLQPLPHLNNVDFSEITQAADNAYNKKNDKNQTETKNERKILTMKTNNPQINNIEKTQPITTDDSSSSYQLYNPAKNTEEITFETVEKNAEKFKESFKEITQSFREQIKDLSDGLAKSQKDLELITQLREQQKPSFFSTLFKRKKNQAEVFVKNGKTYIPVIKESITSPAQIVNSKTLLSYASDWTRTIFSDRVLFKAVPGSGTIMLILPRGNIRFIQFNYKETPIHPTQEDFKTHLAPHKVHIFHHFIDYRNWLYEELRKI